MSLADVLSANNIKSALIVDDVCDVIPTAADLGTALDDWSNFNADLQPEHRASIAEKCPATAHMRFDEQINDDRYVAAVWELREELGVLAEGQRDIGELVGLRWCPPRADVVVGVAVVLEERRRLGPLEA
mgnify:CR=1 FL=1